MTTPAQPAVVSPLEDWFDAELRPVLLERLAVVDGAATASAVQAHNSMTAAIENRIRAYGSRYASASQETRDAVAAIVSELQGMVDDGRPR